MTAPWPSVTLTVKVLVLTVSPDLVLVGLRRLYDEQMEQTYQQRFYAARIAQGLCARCGKNPLSSKTMCQECLDGHKDLMQQVRDDRVEAGLCPVCGKRPPAAGKAFCEQCSTRGQAATRKMVTERRAAGLCVRCGGSELKTKTMCRPCADALNLMSNARNHGLTVDEYQEMLARGCWICGSMENLQVDHDHSCCDYVARGYHRSRSCRKCTRGALCGQHNSIASGLESAEAVRVLDYLLSSAVVSEAPLIALVRQLQEKGGDLDVWHPASPQPAA